MNTPIYLTADFYKLSHREQYPKGTTKVYSTLTPRSNKFAPWADEVVFFGLQYFIKEYLIERFNKEFFELPKEEVVKTYKEFILATLGKETDTKHLEDLHDLGYLPLEIKAIPEGTFASMRTPIMTIENTHDDFFWLTNFIETILSTTIWQPITSATLAHTYRQKLNQYALETAGSIAGVEFQGHDFSMRGMSSEQTAMLSGMGHLTSFVGTDTIPAIFGVNKYYQAPLTAQTGTSIPATEHSVMCSYGQTNELDLFKHLITEVYPTGFFSVVSDTWDFWKVVGEYLPQLKEEIMKRDGRVVIRPDSGNPVDIICGTSGVDLIVPAEIANLAVKFKSINEVHNQFNDNTFIKLESAYLAAQKASLDPDPIDYELNIPKYIRIDNDVFETTVSSHLEIQWGEVDGSSYFRVELKKIGVVESISKSLEEKGLIECLWDIFGGTVNEQGYKVLDTHIGAIYGDSITIERADEICRKLKEKGFASTNVVFGIGSYSYQYHTRDTFGFAVKATYAVVNGEERFLFKDPKTDDGTKRSQRGRVNVKMENNHTVSWEDSLNAEQDSNKLNALTTVFKNGTLLKEYTLEEIRENLKG